MSNLPQLFIEPDKIKGDQLRLPDEDFHHLYHVLRLRPGEEFHLLDGLGGRWLAKLEKGADRLVRVLKKETGAGRPALRITLAQSLPKGKKIEEVIDRAVELGIDRIIPVLTQRSIPLISAQKIAGKTARWNKIAKEAASRAKRLTLPKVEGLLQWSQFLKVLPDFSAVLILWEEEKDNHLRQVLKDLKKLMKKSGAAKPFSLLLLVGPEGGLTPAEIGQLKDKGARTASLGRHILRTETAGQAVLAMLNYEFPW